MDIKKSAGFAAVLAAGLSLITTGTAAADDLECSTEPFTSVAVELSDGGRWTYRYHVTWCVENGEITDLAHHVTNTADGKTCEWDTNAEEGETTDPDHPGAWKGFNMGQFACKKPDGQDGSVNPWGIITVWPNGNSAVKDKGID